jgi:hypothetical protein
MNSPLEISDLQMARALNRISLIVYWHEAAHALAILAAGQVLCRITMAPSCGYTFAKGDAPLKWLLISYLSGPAFDVYQLGNQGTIWKLGCDVGLARKALKDNGIETSHLSDLGVFEKYGKDAKKFISHPLRQKVIRALGRAVRNTEKKRMSGQEIVKFIEEYVNSHFNEAEREEFYHSEDGLSGNWLPLSEHKKE